MWGDAGTSAQHAGRRAQRTARSTVIARTPAPAPQSPATPAALDYQPAAGGGGRRLLGSKKGAPARVPAGLSDESDLVRGQLAHAHGPEDVSDHLHVDVALAVRVEDLQEWLPVKTLENAALSPGLFKHLLVCATGVCVCVWGWGSHVEGLCHRVEVRHLRGWEGRGDGQCNQRGARGESCQRVGSESLPGSSWEQLGASRWDWLQ